MQTIFHRVAQKPGKPLLFGVFQNGPVIFGFPGNPVSTLVCYHVFFRKWLNACLGFTIPKQTAKLSEDFSFVPKLHFHLPVQVTSREGCLWVSPNFGTNSGDMVSLAKANGILMLPVEESEFKKGNVFELVLL